MVIKTMQVILLSSVLQLRAGKSCANFFRTTVSTHATAIPHAVNVEGVNFRRRAPLRVAILRSCTDSAAMTTLLHSGQTADANYATSIVVLFAECQLCSVADLDNGQSKRCTYWPVKLNSVIKLHSLVRECHSVSQ